MATWEIVSAPSGAETTWEIKLYIAIVGNVNVGKTCIFDRFCDNIWNPTATYTVGVDYKTRMVDIDGKKIKLVIYDTPRQTIGIDAVSRLKPLGFLLVYDVTNKDCFDSIRDWISYIKKHVPGDVEVMIVGNKCDLEERRMVSKERGQLLANELGYNFMEVSALSGWNVTMAFMNLARAIIDSKRKQERKL